MTAFASTRTITGNDTPTTADDSGMIIVNGTATITLNATGWTAGESAVAFLVLSGTATFTGSGATVSNASSDLVQATALTYVVAHYRGASQWVVTGTETPYIAGGTDVAIADGGTGASTAAAARNNLQVSGPVITPGQYGAVGDYSTDDTSAFTSMFSAITANGSWSSGFGVRPDTIDLEGKGYVISSNVGTAKGVRLINGALILDGATVTLGPSGSGTAVTVQLSNLDIRYSGTGYYSAALIRTPRVFALDCTDVQINAGTGTNRARYGAFFGEEEGWGINVGGSSRITGGDIALRIGRDSDHTGITIGAGVTIDQSQVACFLGCNLAGFNIAGNIEHSREGGVCLALTSQTNGGSDVLHAGTVSDVYSFNGGRGHGSVPSPLAEAAVLIGHNVPGTTGFDVAAALITSGDATHSVTVRRVYAVSDGQDRAVKIRGFFGLTVEDVKYTVGNVDNIGVEMAGLCAHSHIARVRHQNTGDVNLIEDNSTGSGVGVLNLATGQTYTATNVTTDRAFDADTVAVAELADVVGTLITDLKTSGIIL